MGKNKVYLIGAGPGKPDLITVRGLNILQEADVVIYDYLVDKSLLEYTREGAELICCDKLAKKGRYADGSTLLTIDPERSRRADGFLIQQEKITDLIIKKVKQGRKVARLKNGDVSVFSRLSQELEALVKNGIDYELVPGVTAASAAASFTGIPLTDRKFASSCAFVTGHEGPNKETSNIDWQALSRIGTLVFYMGVENLPKIVRELIKAGKPKNTGCYIIQDASLPSQKVLIADLQGIARKVKKAGIRPPSIIIVGDIVKLGKKFSWLKRSKKIFFTGLSKERFFIKGTYFHLPLVKIKPMKDYREFDNYIKHISVYDWIVFASRYGVEYFFKRLKILGLDARILYRAGIAAVGGSTKNRLLDFGIKADLVPKDESSAGLIEKFSKLNLKDKKIFLPRSDLSGKGLDDGLRKLGASVISSFAYRNVMPDSLPDLNLEDFDEIFFTSPSSVRNFKKKYKKVPGKVRIRSIGEVTLKEIKKCRVRG